MGCEKEFAHLYGATGRPNYSVWRILGVTFLQEMHNLSDQAALDEKRLRCGPKEIHDWYERKSDGWFGLGPSERPDKLDELVVWVKTLIDLFAKDKEVASPLLPSIAEA